MFISKKHIPRRTILRGAGAAFALPPHNELLVRQRATTSLVTFGSLGS